MGKLNTEEIAEIKRLIEAWENCDYSMAITRQLTAKLQETLKNHFTEADRNNGEEWIVNPLWSADGDRLIGYNYVDELVRCRNCEHWDRDHEYSSEDLRGRGYAMCMIEGGWWKPTDYCSFGERREDG